ncbi:hypothetical protein RvY_16916 [Ramazzottius varieornatus]|uniref:UDP-glucuronosyltransferase n=1 Tax=Ramazzottius varieornatus TaxID=947166 RepID=A0A1D1W084_RAMVA|nr:hypothetical protein RvY_16916 [Ramazzottius varieornatus]
MPVKRKFAFFRKRQYRLAPSSFAMARKHILCITIPGYGHLTPLLALARKLGAIHQVTFAVSAHTANQLQQRQLYHVATDGKFIQLYGIPDGIDFDFDDPTDPTVLQRISQLMIRGIEQLVGGIPTRDTKHSSIRGIADAVDVIIADHNIGLKATQIIVDRHVPLCTFIPSGVYCIQMVLAFNEKAYREQKLPKPSKGFFSLPNADGYFDEPPLETLVQSVIIEQKEAVPLATVLIVNSVRSFEQKYINNYEALDQMKDKPTFCVGPLLSEDKTTTKNLAMEEKVRTWLLGREKASVICISFGSIGTPRPEQLKELCKTIVQLDQPVIWSLKSNHYAHLPDELKAMAQAGFEEEMVTDKKVLLVSWAPQKMVLAHENVGLFVSHCGWNSTIEALSEGKPIVGWPQFADQMINAELVEEKGAGVVVRDAGMMDDRLVLAEEIVEKIVAARGKMEGAMALGKCVRQAVEQGGSSYREIRDLLDFIDKNQ